MKPPLPPDDADFWDHLDALFNAIECQDDEPNRIVKVRHRPLVRFGSGMTHVPYSSIDDLLFRGWLELDETPKGTDYKLTRDGKYHRGRWYRRVYDAANRKAAR